MLIHLSARKVGSKKLARGARGEHHIPCMTSAAPQRLSTRSKEVSLVSEDPQPINNSDGTQQETPARQEVDVILDVRELEVDRIKLTVKGLRAHVSVLAELASLVSCRLVWTPG